MYQYGYKLSLVNGDQNHKQNALNFIKKASDKGHLDSMNYYGVLIARGYIDLPNPKEGSRFISISAKYSSIEGMFNYGYILNFGIGIESDKEEAIKYYNILNIRRKEVILKPCFIMHKFLKTMTILKTTKKNVSNIINYQLTKVILIL